MEDCTVGKSTSYFSLHTQNSAWSDYYINHRYGRRKALCVEIVNAHGKNFRLAHTYRTETHVDLPEDAMSIIRYLSKLKGKRISNKSYCLLFENVHDLDKMICILSPYILALALDKSSEKGDG